MNKPFVNPTKGNMTLQMVIPNLHRLLNESPDHIIASVHRQSMENAAQAFDHPEMQVVMAQKVKDSNEQRPGETLEELHKRVADEFRTQVKFIIDNPADQNVRRAVASAGGNIKDFLMEVTTKIIEVARRA